MSAVNPAAARFVNYITAKFDVTQYPNTVMTDIVKIPEEDRKIIENTRKLPDLPQSQIYNAAKNISKWFVLTGFLYQKNVESNVPCAIEMSAQNRLAGFGQKREILTTARSQLLTFVFKEVYQNSKPDELDKIIQQTAPFRTSLDNFSFRFKRGIYKVHGYVSTFFGNTYVKVGFSLIAAWYSYKLYSFSRRIVEDVLRNTVIPRGAHLMMVHAPLGAIRVMNTSLQYVDYIVKNQWKYWSLFIVARLASPRAIQPLLSQVQRVVFFPIKATEYITKVPGKILWWTLGRTFSLSWDAQKIVAERASRFRDQVAAKHYEEEGLKALQLWTNLMENGAESGLFVKEEAHAL